MFDILQYEFIQNALLAGTCIALVSAMIGYFIIARGLTFAAHALPNIGFAGAAGAVLVGASPVVGLLVFSVGAGAGIALLSKRLRQRDITIGIFMTFALGLSYLFLSLYSGYAERVYSILFGTVVGISRQDVVFTAISSAIIAAVVLLLFRQLLFSSVDPEVAEARGVRTQALALVFLVLVAVTVSIAVQVIGALLLFTLLIGPAATAMRLVRRPPLAIIVASLLGIFYTWLGILFAGNGNWPVSFYIATLSFAVYLPVRLLSPYWAARRSPRELTRQKGAPVTEVGAVEAMSEVSR